MFELKELFSHPKKPLGLVREQVDGKEVVKLRGPFQEMNDIRGNKNKNGRVYTKDLWEKALADKAFQERMSNKRVVGELDHPDDDGKMRRTSHFVTKVWPDYNEGLVYGEIELLNHNQGDAALLRALVEQGMQVCVSSRGFGDFLKDGCTVDPETYKLHTWDIVLDPSVPIAALNRVAESVNEKLAPENRAREHFIEVVPMPVCKGSGCGGHKKEEETIDKPINKESGQMDPKIMELMEKNAALAVDKAKLESANESLRSLVTEKNAAIDKCEKQIVAVNEKFVAVEGKVVTLTEDLRKTTEAKTHAENTVKEYESIEDRAISTIGALREQVAEYDATGNKAADLIESLRSQVKGLSKKNEGKKPAKKNEGKGKNEAGEDDLAKIDKKNKAAGELRSWEPGAKGEEAEGEDDDDGEEKEEDAAIKEPTEDDPVAKDQKQQDEEADDDDEDDDEKPQVDEGEEEEEEGKGKKDEEGEEEDPDAAKKKNPFGKEEAKRFPMLGKLSEAMVRDQRPRKVQR